MQINTFLQKFEELLNLKDKSKKDASSTVFLVVGRKDSGKSTLIKLLFDIVFQTRNSPVLVELDVGQNDLAIPGTMGYSNIRHEWVSDFKSKHELLLSKPYILFFGHTSPGSNIPHFKDLIDELVRQLVNIRSSYVLINTCGWIEGGGFELLLYIVKSFNVNHMIIIDNNDDISSKLSQNQINSSIKIHILERAPNVIVKSRSARANLRSQSIRTYFYGPSNNMFPVSNIFKFSDICIIQIQSYSNNNNLSNQNHNNQLNSINITPHIIQQVLAVSSAQNRENVFTSPVMGFVVVTGVDCKENKLTLLCPRPGPLPGKFLLLGTCFWTDCPPPPKDLINISSSASMGERKVRHGQ